MIHVLITEEDRRWRGVGERGGEEGTGGGRNVAVEGERGKRRWRSHVKLTETKRRKSRGRDGGREGRGNDGMSSERCWSLLKRTRVLLNHSKLQRLFIKALPGDGSPPSPLLSPLHPHPSFLHCLSHSLSLSPPLPASTQPLKTAGREASEREEERGRDKRAQREKRSAMQATESHVCWVEWAMSFLRIYLLLLLLELNQQCCLALLLFTAWMVESETNEKVCTGLSEESE